MSWRGTHTHILVCQYGVIRAAQVIMMVWYNNVIVSDDIDAANLMI